MEQSLGVVIVAAGNSRRMGFDKILAPLAGRPVLLHSAAAFLAMPEAGPVMIVAHPDRREQLEQIVDNAFGAGRARVVAGGSSRPESVRNGLLALPEDTPWAAVHDGARPLITPPAILHCLELAQKYGCAACAAPVTDTLKRARLDESAAGDPLICGDVDRANLWALQTPQIAQRRDLLNALEDAARAGVTLTDETSAFRRLDQAVAIAANPAWNPKITFPGDLELVEAWLARKTP